MKVTLGFVSRLRINRKRNVNIPVMSVASCSNILTKLYNVNCLKGLPREIKAFLPCVNKCASVKSKSDVGLRAKAQRQQCGPPLDENTGSLLMLRTGPF